MSWTWFRRILQNHVQASSPKHLLDMIWENFQNTWTGHDFVEFSKFKSRTWFWEILENHVPHDSGEFFRIMAHMSLDYFQNLCFGEFSKHVLRDFPNNRCWGNPQTNTLGGLLKIMFPESASGEIWDDDDLEEVLAATPIVMCPSKIQNETRKHGNEPNMTTQIKITTATPSTPTIRAPSCIHSETLAIYQVDRARKK